MKQIAKKLTLCMLLLSFLVGVIMMFIPNLSMERYTTFVKAFMCLYTPMVASVGINSGISKIKEKTNCVGDN